MGEPLVRHVEIPVRAIDRAVALPGDLAVPDGAVGLVVFAHGSGSSRLSPRNREVAGVLQAAGMATLLFDLLMGGEAEDRRNVFDVELLGERLLAATRWVRGGPTGEEDPSSGASHQFEPQNGATLGTIGLPLAYFGASTGAAAAMWAAGAPGADVRVVVSRGGRPDLAASRLPQVRAPTLLIVGELDHEVLELNRKARTALRSAGTTAELVVVPGATHLFEEPGAIEEVSAHAAAWFARYCSR